MLYIRADGNAKIGTGHIMRCLSIAKAARTVGLACTFITADLEMEPLIREQGFDNICLYSQWNDLDQETNQMLRLIKDRSIRKLLLDSYFVTPGYMQRLHSQTHLIYLDDLDAFHYPCSTLINYNIYADQLDYPSRYPDTRLLLGPQYAPLRKEFRQIAPTSQPHEITNIFLTTGGTDAYNIAGRLLENCHAHQVLTNKHFHIIAGRYNMNLNFLHSLTKQMPNITVHTNVTDISNYMVNCHIAISAGGSTLYELCACGLPTICFSFADNQVLCATSFDCLGYMKYAGDFRDGFSHWINAVLTGIEQLDRSRELRQSLSNKMQTLVDGSGTVHLLSALFNTPTKLT